MEQQIQLLITVLPNGAVQVQGPLANKMLCYGMLEAAKDAIRDHVAKNQSMIVPATALPALNESH